MEGLTKKQKEFADEYLATGKFPDGIKRSCFNARCRYKGEWFNPDKEMLLMIDDIIKIQKNAN